MPPKEKKKVRRLIGSNKYNIKNETDEFEKNLAKNYWDEIVNRNRLFYCTHMNRKNAFFQKHVLNAKVPPKQVAYKIFQEMFGFTRIRKSVKEHVLQMLVQVVKKQKHFDYNYYLTKNCPLPNDWKNHKKVMLEEAALGGTHRQAVFKELFLSESQYRNVADFLTEFVANVFPPDFIAGKNKKVFNKKVYQFVKFNRFEMFTKITLLDRFNINDVSWLKFSASNSNARYFQNENVWILWRVLKWIFEELLISLLRCFFYCTEK